MKITEVQITPIKADNGLVAIASIVFDNALFLGSIGVFTKLNGSGYRLTYPTKGQEGRNFNIFHPIRQEVSKAIEDAIFGKAEQILNQRSNDNVGYRNPHNS